MTRRAPKDEEAVAVKRWVAGHAAASARMLELAAAEGPDPEQAVREALSAARAVAELGGWPGPRDTVAEAAVAEVRLRWARIQKRAMREG